METAATEQVNRVYEQRKSNSKHRKKYKPPPKQEMKTTAQKTCPFCGGDHDGPRTKCPASGKTCSNCRKKGHFTMVCLHKNRKRADHVSDQTTLEDSEEDEYAFSVTASKKRPIVTVLLNGVKGRMDADSCASANIMDREQSYYKSSSVCLSVCLFVPLLLRAPLTDLRQTWWVYVGVPRNCPWGVLFWKGQRVNGSKVTFSEQVSRRYIIW